MLFIYGALGLGGIETFFVRLAKERFRRGLVTKILLLSGVEKSNDELLADMKKYASVYYAKDIFYGPPIISRVFTLLMPIRYRNLEKMLDEVGQIHVADGWTALLGHRLLRKVRNGAFLTVGFYHSREYLWMPKDGRLPYFERVNRNFVLKYLPKSNLCVFSDSMIDLYHSEGVADLTGAQTFRIGVVNKPDETFTSKLYVDSSELKICSVGRLVDFKAYNLWMIDVVRKLRKKGINAVYHIYGDGPLKAQMLEKIKDYGLQDFIELKGCVKYSDFNECVKGYDCFIGSGTSVIQSSSLGVCSLVGIESVRDDETYGFFPDCSHVEYNIDALSLTRYSVCELLEDFYYSSSGSKNMLSREHLRVTGQFYVENTVSDFCGIPSRHIGVFREVNVVLYQLSVVYYCVLRKYFNAARFTEKYDK